MLQFLDILCLSIFGLGLNLLLLFTRDASVLSESWKFLNLRFRRNSSVSLVRHVVFLCGVGVNLRPFSRSLISNSFRFLDETIMIWVLHFDSMPPEVVCFVTTFVITFANKHNHCETISHITWKKYKTCHTVVILV